MLPLIHYGYLQSELYESFRKMQAKNAASKTSSTNKDNQHELSTGNQIEDQASVAIIHPIFNPNSKSTMEKKQKTVRFAPLPGISNSNQEEAVVEAEVLELSDDGTFDLSTVRPASKTEESNQVDDIQVSDTNSHNEQNDQEEEEEFETAELPPPRACVKSEIEFTPRVFPTPSRESKAAEEEDWLIKNHKHLSSHKGLRRSSDYDISESDRMYLSLISPWYSIEF